MSLPSRGAWIEMSGAVKVAAFEPSLPSRGAWIEIPPTSCPPATPTVAPLAGSVDRNGKGGYLESTEIGSLPSRGAWIEIPAPH